MPFVLVAALGAFLFGTLRAEPPVLIVSCAACVSTLVVALDLVSWLKLHLARVVCSGYHLGVVNAALEPLAAELGITAVGTKVRLDPETRVPRADRLLALRSRSAATLCCVPHAGRCRQLGPSGRVRRVSRRRLPRGSLRCGTRAFPLAALSSITKKVLS